MKELNRTRVGRFNIEDSVTVSGFKEEIEKGDFSHIISVEKIFESASKVEISNKELQKFLNGVLIPINDCKANRECIYKVYNNNNFIGIGRAENNYLKRDVIIGK